MPLWQIQSSRGNCKSTEYIVHKSFYRDLKCRMCWLWCECGLWSQHSPQCLLWKSHIISWSSGHTQFVLGRTRKFTCRSLFFWAHCSFLFLMFLYRDQQSQSIFPFYYGEFVHWFSDLSVVFQLLLFLYMWSLCKLKCSCIETLRKPLNPQHSLDGLVEVETLDKVLSQLPSMVNQWVKSHLLKHDIRNC